MKYLSLFLLLLSLFDVDAVEMTSGFVNNNGVSIHYIEKKHPDAEQKPTLLFIPGLSMPASIWKKQLDAFSQDYSVAAMDPRSQGESTQTSEGQYQASRAGDIKAVVDQLHLKPVVLVGWSLAVSEVVAYLSEFGSEGIKGVVLVDGFVGLDPGSPNFNGMLAYWSEFQKNRLSKTREFVSGMFVQPQTDEYLANLTATSLRMPTSTLMALVYNFILIDYRPTLPKIDIPVLVITINAPWQEEMRKLQQLIPHSQLEIIPNAAHAVFVDQPEQFNSLVKKFVTTLQNP